MKAYLINATDRTIEAVEYNGDYTEIYRLCGFDCFDAARFNKRGDAVFIDDEALFKNPQHFFLIEGYHQPLAGNGLVLGCDEEGESVEPTVSLDWLRARVKFMTLTEVQDWAA